jgi:hypothetical protein
MIFFFISDAFCLPLCLPSLCCTEVALGPIIR